MKKMTSTTIFEFGDIIVVDFPFSGGKGIKRRPAVVINSNIFSKEREDLILIPITSKIDKAKSFEPNVDGWKEAGLLKESCLKAIIFTIEKTGVYKKIGCLSSQDLTKLKEFLKIIIG